ncbi:cupin domain-containing protein [Tumebacillus permanentifrigoris]|uniref:Mannose-6-phosphate isomerase-like protein (Cupin superfamily) n=1 Tax=Tumebacillus permanentifrigoris TaxID=378543 RepID=A0A316D7X8_9BACL|nr:cupin domain-containing protein [Tumebacillus permanentifrigoris]PWK09035.1 mannose-6-phosphate isomerase-like protein (cupin superfamily) [Tumebacillus permanentifrigoris]
MKVNTTNTEHYKWGASCDGWHLVKTPGLSVIQELMPAGTVETRHYHEQACQFFYVLSGRLTMEVEGVFTELSPFEGLEIAPHRWHQARNETDADVAFLVISQPTTRGDRFQIE